MKVETSTPDGVMKPIGPYSHIAKAGSLISISGTAGVDGGKEVYAQTRRILDSFRTMLATVGSDMDHILHIHVFLKHIEDFEEMNRAYREEITGQLPARTVVGVADLPKKGALLTMNLTAVTKDG